MFHPHHSGSTPHTFLSTKFKGGVRTHRSRLQNLFPGTRRSGWALLCAVALLAGLVGGMTACSSADPQPPSSSPSASPLPTEDAPEGLPLMMLPPTAELFGITGLEGTLYEAARLSLNPELWQDGHLQIPFVGVYASYENEDGDTVYLCNLWSNDYYDYLSLRGANAGGGGGPAAITIHENEDGSFFWRKVETAWDGEGYAASIRLMCEPIPGLADQLLGGSVPYLFTTPGTETLLYQYGEKIIGAVDETNVNKEAAADTYLAQLKAAGPGDAKYDAVVSAFGPDAWDRVAYTMAQTQGIETRSAYLDRETGEELTESEYLERNLAFWTGLAEAHGFTVGELMEPGLPQNIGPVTTPEDQRAFEAFQLFLSNVDKTPGLLTNVATYDAWQAGLTFDGRDTAGDGTYHYRFTVSNRHGIWGMETPLTWDTRNDPYPTGD